jgi:hypothetical protein
MMPYDAQAKPYRENASTTKTKTTIIIIMIITITNNTNRKAVTAATAPLTAPANVLRKQTQTAVYFDRQSQ